MFPEWHISENRRHIIADGSTKLKKYRVISSLLLTVVLLLSNIQNVRAFPPLPSSFYGTAKINGLEVPAGTNVIARINGVQYASSFVSLYQGEMVYSLDVPGDDMDTPGTIEGGKEGDTIVFYIGNIKATQTAIWHGGTLVSLNLTGYSAGPASFTLFLPIIKR
jgi:hypothetical protein